jgi:hypothetical protein
MSLGVEVVLSGGEISLDVSLDGGLTRVEILQPAPISVELSLTQPGPMGPQGQKGDPGEVVSEASIRAIAADQDTVQVYDFDAIVATNLGV